MPLSNIAPRHLEPGAAVTIDPAGATDPATVRWRHLGGIVPLWAYDTSGRCALSVPLSAVRGGTILMRAEEGWLPFPAPGLPVGSERVSYFSGATHQVDESVRHEGARTLKVTPTSAWDGAAFVAPVTPGKPYEFEAHIRSGTATPGYTVQLSVTWLNGSNATISNSSGPAVAPPNGTWGRITHSGTSPAGAASVRVQTMHSDLTNPQPYWLGFIGGRATDTALTIKDAASSADCTTYEACNAEQNINFTNNGEEYQLLWSDNHKFKKGAYTVLLYADNAIMGRSSVVLK